MRRTGDNSIKALVFLIIMVLLLGVAVVVIYLNTRSDEIALARNEQRPIPILLSLHDQEEHLFSELFLFHPVTGKGAVFDIPGEIGVMIASENRIDRVDRLYSVEDNDIYREAVSRLVGMEIPYFMQFSAPDFIDAVDILGGVDTFIANPVEYMENEHMILLPSGSVVLDGDKALMYGTYFEPEEPELERINRRQRLIQAFMGKLGETAPLLRDRKALDLFEARIDTNLDRNALLSLIDALSVLDSDRIIFQRVLGTRREVDGSQLLFPHYEGKLVRETVDQTLISIANEAVVSDEELALNLRILNGTARNGLAGRTSTVFKSFGYEVLTVGNAEGEELEKTYVVDHTGDISKAQRVANVIRCREVKTGAESDLSAIGENGLLIDVTIVLGKDFDGRYCKAE